MTNDLQLQQEYFIKNSTASLDCISISELCSAINSSCYCSWKRHFAASNWHIKIWQDNIWNSLHETNRKYENL